MKNCPFCAEEIRSEAIVCKHCGQSVVPKEWETFLVKYNRMSEAERQMALDAMKEDQRSYATRLIVARPPSIRDTSPRDTSQSGTTITNPKAGKNPMITGGLIMTISVFLMFGSCISGVQSNGPAAGLWTLFFFLTFIAGFVVYLTGRAKHWYHAE